ncbi:MAG TPA: ABC transporter ATP-binding protein [Solirubrobacteraceae bacterium]|nr:ABC transporter ATP-binding protein [Solirubrobacteraceae bacterium]
MTDEVSGQQATKPTLSKRARLNMLLGDRRRSVVALAGCSILSGFTEAGTLALIAQIAASLVKGGKHVNASIGHFHVHASMGTLIEVAFALTLLRLVLQIPLSVLPARIVAGVQASMRVRLFDAFARASWDVQSRDVEGQLQDTMTTQVMQATAGALQTTIFINSLFTFLVLMGTAFALNSVAALIVGGTSVLLFGLLRPLRRLGVRYSRSLSQAQVEYAGGIAEAIRLAQETQVFGAVDPQRKRVGVLIGNSNQLAFRAQLLGKLVGNLYQSLIYMLMVAGIAGLYLAGAKYAGSLGGVILVLLRAGTSGQLVQGSYQSIAQALPFMERTQDAMNRYAESAPKEGSQPLTQISGLAFENVSFAYNEGRPVLSELSFEVAANEVIGIIGPSGAGKSTIVQLLLQLRAPDTGRYLVNGRRADEFARADWHKQVSYVPQEPRLLHATVSENIRFFRDLDDEAVTRAAKLARIDEDIMSWPMGYETLVGPRADAVSGGQQQRICLARALAAQPEMIVLDEPTSALDPGSERLIGESLQGLKSQVTLFIIAHRMSTLDMCDRVMVIVDGRLVGFDTKALLQRDNTYYRHASALAAGTSPVG